jgi:hypothetical protein
MKTIKISKLFLSVILVAIISLATFLMQKTNEMVSAYMAATHGDLKTVLASALYLGLWSVVLWVAYRNENELFIGLSGIFWLLALVLPVLQGVCNSIGINFANEFIRTINEILGSPFGGLNIILYLFGFTVIASCISYIIKLILITIFMAASIFLLNALNRSKSIGLRESIKEFAHFKKSKYILAAFIIIIFMNIFFTMRHLFAFL